jgi:endonuclease/exonuclease/phosphatase family metal-dependent hydrolase
VGWLAPERRRVTGRTSFLFWNTKRKPVAGLLAVLAAENDLDLIILAEPPPDRDAVLRALNTGEATFDFHRSHTDEARLHLYSRYDGRTIVPVYDDRVMSARLLRLPGAKPVLLILAHFRSKAFGREDIEQLGAVGRAREEIEKIEKTKRTERTIVLGDLNIDPYSKAITQSDGLHAVMCRDIARRGFRIVEGVKRFMFYNPMWSLLGDHPAGPPGTYFYDRAGMPLNYFWHTYDQVLFRPCLMGEFNFDTLRILTSAGGVSLVTRDGRPDGKVASDHLPITFSFSLKGSRP